MKLFALILMVVMLAAAVLAVPTEGPKVAAPRKCVPGKQYFNGCNTCFCSDDGHPYCNAYRCPDDNSGVVLQAPADYWQTSQ